MTNICLQAVQRALEGSDRSNVNLLFTPQDATAASGVHSSVASPKSHSRSNIEGLLLYHPLIVQNPWEPPKDLDRLIDDLIAERKLTLFNEPITYGTRTMPIRHDLR